MLDCFSCDKYWHCQDGYPELKTCGNGLGFLDNDDTFTLEQVKKNTDFEILHIQTIYANQCHEG